jgi:hypothetical protein
MDFAIYILSVLLISACVVVVLSVTIRVLAAVVVVAFKTLNFVFRVFGFIVTAPVKITGIGREPRVEPVTLGTPCPQRRCGCGNPASARFCRRCGRLLPSPLA